MKKTTFTQTIPLALLSAFILFAIIASVTHAANLIGSNNRNVTVHTTVNITNSKPEITAVTVFQETNISLRNITLSAGSTRIVTCNATVRDWNGYNDIINVNATLYDMINSNNDAADDNNTHYTNANCTNGGNGVNYTVNYLCTFNVYYYANNGTWNCNTTAMDNATKIGWNANTTVFYPLYALNVTDGIDYGNVAVEDYSATVTANVTNFGNRPINVSVEGYGVTRGDGLAMTCLAFGAPSGNITVANERFSASNVAWGSKIPLTSTAQNISGLTVDKQTVPGTLMLNTTYWQLYIPANPGGNCTGYVIFQAESS